MVTPTVEYASTVWDPVNQKKHQITGSGTETSGTICCVTNMVKTLEWESLQDRRKTKTMHAL